MQQMQEMWFRSLGWEDHLEKEVTIHFSILAWEIPWTEVPGRLQSMGLQRVGHDLTIGCVSLNLNIESTLLLLPHPSGLICDL